METGCRQCYLLSDCIGCKQINNDDMAGPSKVVITAEEYMSCRQCSNLTTEDRGESWAPRYKYHCKATKWYGAQGTEWIKGKEVDDNYGKFTTPKWCPLVVQTVKQ